jgi:branched-subunit amino acid ABC-type transport system permease component
VTQFGQQLVNGLSIGFAYALIALGFTLVFGTLKVLNFAHSNVLMMSAFVGWWVRTELGLNLALALLAAIAFGAALTVVIDRALIRPVVHQSFIAPFITTLGASLLLVATAKKIWGTDPHTFPAAFPIGTLHVGEVAITGIQLVVGVTSILVMIGLGALVYRTGIGLQIRASAQNPDMARASGVNTAVVATATMGLAGVLAAIAGVFLAVSFGVVSPFVGDSYGLKGQVAMIIGGIGSLKGAVIAGIAIGVGEVMTVGYVSSTWRDGIAFGLLIVVLLLKPHGLFGSKERYVPSAV